MLKAKCLPDLNAGHVNAADTELSTSAFQIAYEKIETFPQDIINERRTTFSPSLAADII